MGNRAVLAFGNIDDDSTLGIYLHWNGGRDSIEGFLQAARALGVRPNDEVYAAARVCQIIGNFFGGTLSVGVSTLGRLDTDNGDNGVYEITPDLYIGKRKFNRGEQVNPEVTAGIAAECVKRMRAIEKMAKD